MASAEEVRNYYEKITEDDFQLISLEDALKLKFKALGMDNTTAENLAKVTAANKSSFLAILTDGELHKLSDNISKFVPQVAIFTENMAVNIPAAAASITSAPAVPSMLTSCANEYLELESLAKDILYSATSLGIPLPDALMNTIKTLETIGKVVEGPIALGKAALKKLK